MSARSDSRTAGLALFGETLLTGVVLAVLAAPLVTALPALAAGIAHLRRHLAGEPDSVRALLRDFGGACRQLWPLAVAAPGLLLVLLWNLSLAQAGLLPASPLSLAATAGLLAVFAVLFLRTAAQWSAAQWSAAPCSSRVTLLRSAARRTGQDSSGSGLLLLALAVCGLLGWMLLPLLLIVGGLLALAVLAVDQRTG